MLTANLQFSNSVDHITFIEIDMGYMAIVLLEMLIKCPHDDLEEDLISWAHIISTRNYKWSGTHQIVHVTFPTTSNII